MPQGVFPPGSVIPSSLAYFYCGAACLVVCCLAYFVLHTRPLSVFAFRRAGIQHPLSGWSALKGLEGSGPDLGPLEPLLEEDEHRDLSSESVTGASKPAEETAGLDKEVSAREVLWRALPNHLLVAAMFGTTLAVWPGLTSELKSHQWPELDSSGWWPLILLTIFSVFDVVGRFCVPITLGITCNTVWIPILARVCVVPMMILAVKGAPFFVHDAWSVAFILFMGFTNGYVGTLSIVVVNQRFEHPQEKRHAGGLTSFYLNAGLVLGSSIGLILEKYTES